MVNGGVATSIVILFTWIHDAYLYLLRMVVCHMRSGILSKFLQFFFEDTGVGISRDLEFENVASLLNS